MRARSTVFAMLLGLVPQVATSADLPWHLSDDAMQQYLSDPGIGVSRSIESGAVAVLASDVGSGRRVIHVDLYVRARGDPGWRRQSSLTTSEYQVVVSFEADAVVVSTRDSKRVLLRFSPPRASDFDERQYEEFMRRDERPLIELVSGKKKQSSLD